MRALELYGGRLADAEDAVGDVYLALVRKPPSPRRRRSSHHWLRTVLRNLNARRLRDLDGEDFPVSLDGLQGWVG
jgi:DNA-directed RNA polymerase specialized sigma24 family protein